jgi:hypothetical protein
MIPALEEACGVKFPPGPELHTAETGEFLKELLKKMKLEMTPPYTNARMLDYLVGEFIVSVLDQYLNKITDDAGRRRLASTPHSLLVIRK